MILQFRLSALRFKRFRIQRSILPLLSFLVQIVFILVCITRRGCSSCFLATPRLFPVVVVDGPPVVQSSILLQSCDRPTRRLLLLSALRPPGVSINSDGTMLVSYPAKDLQGTRSLGQWLASLDDLGRRCFDLKIGLDGWQFFPISEKYSSPLVLPRANSFHLCSHIQERLLQLFPRYSSLASFRFLLNALIFTLNKTFRVFFLFSRHFFRPF